MGHLETRKRWPGNKIPYTVADDILIDNSARNSVFQAIQEWNTKTILQFVPRFEEDDFVTFTKSPDACTSPVGRQGGRQFVRCPIGAAGSFTAGSIMHEIGHAFGFYHEQQRPDRDRFVSVSSSDMNFRIERGGSMLTFYDCASIMHYAVTPGKLTTIPGGCPATIGQRTGLSPRDITAVSGWQELDNNPATIAVAADITDGRLYQLHNDGRIWRYTGPPLTGWQELDNNPASIAITAGGGQLYQLHNDGRIWRYTGPPFTGWQEFPRTGFSPASVNISGMHILVQLHSSGNIFRYTRLAVPYYGLSSLHIGLELI
jgi:hypothetical protein